MDRQQLRKTLRSKRQALSARERRRHALSLASRLVKQPFFRNAQRIALYLPNDGEMDLRPLMKRSVSMGKKLYLPIIYSLGHNKLGFAPYQPGQDLRLNLYGIPEPKGSNRAGRSAIGLDVILLPLVGFDQTGNRLGMGGGYYDRSLAFLNRRNAWKRPVLIGVAYEFQKVENLENQSWDIPLDGIITESCIYPGNNPTRAG